MTLSTKQSVIYEAFGFRIRSELTLPELALAQDQEMNADIEIRLSELHKEINGNRVDMDAGKVYIEIQDAASYCIENGNTINVSIAEHASLGKVRLYLLGSCMGALMLQRGILPLHGSAVVIDGEAYVFIGESGAGKSTLASAMLVQGGRLLSDDVSAVSIDEQGKPIVAAAYPQQKLWQESLTHFGMSSAPYQSVLPDEEKYAVPVQHGWHAGEVPLAGVYELTKSVHADAPHIHPVKRLEQLHLLLQHTYRHSLIKRMGLVEWQFTTASSLLGFIQVKRLTRPVHRFTATQLASIVLNDIRRKDQR